jgi:phage terminase small subunit
MVDSNEEELSETEKAFIEAFLTNGRKAGPAYQSVKGTENRNSADASGCRMLKKVEKTQYFAKKNQEILTNYGLSMKSQIERLESIYKKSMQGKAKLEFDREAKQMTEVLDEDGNIVYEYDSRGALGAIQEMNKMVGFHKETAMKLKLEGVGKGGEIEIAHVKLD